MLKTEILGWSQKFIKDGEIFVQKAIKYETEAKQHDYTACKPYYILQQSIDSLMQTVLCLDELIANMASE